MSDEREQRGVVMEIHDKIAEIVELVDSARTIPMSSSVVVNKRQILVLLDEVRESLPGNLQAAEAVLGQREALLVEARSNAQRIVAEGQAEHARLVADHAVTQQARLDAEEMVRQARDEADSVRRDADEYVDVKLARLEEASNAIVDVVRQGRERLREAGDPANAHTPEPRRLPKEAERELFGEDSPERMDVVAPEGSEQPSLAR